MAVLEEHNELAPRESRAELFYKYLRRHPSVLIGGILLLAIILLSFIGPIFTVDPLRMNPISRLKPPSGDLLFGTDMFGRDIFARVVAGGQISLVVGVSVAVISTFLGLVIGIVAGFSKKVDAVIMRFMDGLMAIPGLLLAIALISLNGASILTVIIAITVPELPRVVRLVRSVVLSLREQIFVQAAISVGMPTARILIVHIVPNALPPLIVQASYICASAMILEAILSFLGAGTPPEIPSWGNIVAEGRTYFQISPWIVLFPGLFLAITVLAVNILGDGLRDSLDPRMRRAMR